MLSHQRNDDSDPEIVEARRTQVLSGTQHYFHQEENDEDETETEKDGSNGGRRSSSRGQTRAKNAYKSIIQDRKGVVEKEEEEEDIEENKGKVLSAEENNSKNRPKNGRSIPDEDQVDEEDEEQSSIKPTKNSSIESKSNKTFNDTKVKTEEANLQVSPLSSESSSSTSLNSQPKQKTANDSHKNYTRLEPIRGRKSLSLTSSGSVGLTSTTPSAQFRRQRTPSHIQFDITSEAPDILLESIQNSKKRRRILTTSSSTTPTPQTMPYNLYNHFRPLEQDVPQDHLLPFLDFGKKLSPGIPPTPSGINSIENKSVNQRHRSKENVTPEYRSSALDEDVLLHEDMDVTIQKKTIERNNIPRVKVQQIRDPYISGYYRRRPTTTAQPTQSTTSKNSENTIITTTDCSSVLTKDNKNDSDGVKSNSDSGKSGASLYYKHNSRTNSNNRTKCEYIDDSISSTTTKYNSNKSLQDNIQINEKLLSRNISNYRSSSFNNTKILDFENIKTNLSNTRLQKFERMKMEPSSSVAPSLETTTINIFNTTKRILPVKFYLRHRNTTTSANNETAITQKNNEEIKSTADPLMHEESNTYEKTTNSSSQQPPKKQQIITTISPSNQQLTTRILSTAVVTSVSVKESLNKNDNMSLKDNETKIDTDRLSMTKNITASDINKNESTKLLNASNSDYTRNNKNISLINDEKSLNALSHFPDSTISDSSPKITMKPTESTILNNRTIPEDFIEVPRIFTKYPRTTTIPTMFTENNNRKEYNKTLITNPLYKPKIILPRTKAIVSTTPKATTLIPPTKMTRTSSIKARFDEKLLSKGTISPIQFTPTKFLSRSSIYTKDTTTSLPTISLMNVTNNFTVSELTPSVEISTIKPNNDEDENKNTALTSTPSDFIYNVKDNNSTIIKTSDTDSKLLVKEGEIKIKEEEIIPNEKRVNVESSRKSNIKFHGDPSLRNENINQGDKNNSGTPKIEPVREIKKSNDDHYQSDDNHDNIPEENDQELSEMHETFFTSTPISTIIVPDKKLQNTTTTIARRVTTHSTTLPPLLTSSVSALDHKWLHSTGLRSNHNLSITDGQHTDVGVAYPQGVHIATYVFTGLGIIPILLLAIIVARVFIIRNRKKVLDESEYSSEYNRSPLGTTNSPLPTKLPRVPAHLGWEVEKAPPLPPIPLTSTRWEFPRDKLRLQTVLGQGNFGQVWKAEADDISGHEGLTRLVAVKTVKEGASNREREDLLRELGIMQELGAHPNVVTLLGCCTEKEPYLLIMEYVMYGKLLAFLRDHRTRAHYYNFSESTDALTSRDLTVFAYCVARGMDYLTTKGIIHRDIAARNVLVDHNKLCKIADFGMSRNVRDTGQIYEQRQSKGALPIRWMAPESLHFSLFTHKTDVWSFGILMWEIVTLGSTPYANMGAREVMRRVREGYRLDRPVHCHQEFFRVIQRCWHSEPAKRPTFAELKHELGQLLSDSEHGGGFVDLDGLAEEIKHHNHSGASTLQRPHNH